MIGPYTIILGSPAQIEDVIQYADFTKRVSPVRLADQSTVDEEPDVEALHGLMDGSIQLNDTDLHVLPSGEFLSIHPVTPETLFPTPSSWLGNSDFFSLVVFRFLIWIESYVTPFVQKVSFLRTVPTVVFARTFCTSRDTRVSYGWCLLIQGYLGAG